MSQFANAPTNQSNALRSSASLAGGCRTSPKTSHACRLNASGQRRSHGSGSSNANSTARDDASGRRAHHRVQRRRMPVPDRLLPRRVLRYLGDWKVDLGEPRAFAANHWLPTLDPRILRSMIRFNSMKSGGRMASSLRSKSRTTTLRSCFPESLFPYLSSTRNKRELRVSVSSFFPRIISIHRPRPNPSRSSAGSASPAPVMLHSVS